MGFVTVERLLLLLLLFPSEALYFSQMQTWTNVELLLLPTPFGEQISTKHGNYGMKCMEIY